MARMGAWRHLTSISRRRKHRGAKLRWKFVFFCFSSAIFAHHILLYLWTLPIKTIILDRFQSAIMNIPMSLCVVYLLHIYINIVWRHIKFLNISIEEDNNFWVGFMKSDVKLIWFSYLMRFCGNFPITGAHDIAWKYENNINFRHLILIGNLNCIKKEIF